MRYWQAPEGFEIIHLSQKNDDYIREILGGGP
jgi:hypothetical protein